MLRRITAITKLGLGYLTLERNSTTLSPGELQRLRLATQICSQLFGVVYVLDEPSAGLHPADAASLYDSLRQLQAAGNSLFVVEHDLEIMRRADWIIDVGPAAGSGGGRILYSGPPQGLAAVALSQTAAYLFRPAAVAQRPQRSAAGWLQLSGITRNNLRNLEARFPIVLLTVVTGVSGSGKSSLVSGALIDLVQDALGAEPLRDL